MKRSPGRFASQAPLRHAVAVEAARLLYHREFKEYYQAKREAARRHGCKVLPTNHEIHHQLLLIAQFAEGPQRTARLTEMRQAALQVMEILQEFQPKLIGSVWTGHIRRGSDIDINLYAEGPDGVLAALQRANLSARAERVQARQGAGQVEFVHLHLHHPSGHEIEITLYPPEDVRTHPNCSITGGPISRGSLLELRELLSQHSTQSPPVERLGEAEKALQSFLLGDFSEGQLLALLPELAACGQTPQNHYHHLDVLGHTLEVVHRVVTLRQERYQSLRLHKHALREHLAQPGPGGWNREALLVLVALLHDVGKPRTLSFHPSGRIQFPGHESVGAELAREIAGRLGLGAAVTEALHRLVALHMRPVLLGDGRPQPSSLHFMLREAGDLAPELLLLSLADVLSARGPAQPGYRGEEQHLFVEEMLREFFERGFLRFPNLPVGSVDLRMEYGVEDSSLCARMLEQLTADYLDGEFQGREDGLARAAELLEAPADLW